MPTKAKKPLLEALKTVLQSSIVGTQEEIKHALAQQGYVINQSKISRLLRKLGAVKVTNERKQIIYSLPLEPAPPSSKNVLSHLILNITMNETLIVVYTNPGSASLVARLLDHHRQELKILGTVAGDDTLFIAPASVKLIRQTANAIKTFLAEIS